MPAFPACSSSVVVSVSGSRVPVPTGFSISRGRNAASPEGRRGTEVDRQEPGSLTAPETLPAENYREPGYQSPAAERSHCLWMFLEA